MKFPFSPDPAIEANPLYRGALNICRELTKHGYAVFLVGGSVRDLLLCPSRVPHDFDIATEAMPKDVAALFKGTEFVGKAFGVSLVKQGGHGYEVTTFRKEGHYSDRRHPDSIGPGTLEDDSRRRDFTINALYFDPLRNEILDLHGGKGDLEQKLMRCVGEARERLHEDALRIVRLFRFCANFSFEVESKTLQAAIGEADGLRLLSKERILQEFLKVKKGRFHDFSKMFLGKVALENVDATFSALRLESARGREWDDEAHLITPVSTFCYEILRRVRLIQESSEICAKVFLEWPLTGQDKCIVEFLTLDFCRCAAQPHDEVIWFYRIWRLLKKQSVLTWYNLSCFLELLGFEGEVKLVFQNLRNAVTLLSQGTPTSIASAIKKLPLERTSEVILKEVKDAGFPIEYVGIFQSLDGMKTFAKQVNWKSLEGALSDSCGYQEIAKKICSS